MTIKQPAYGDIPALGQLWKQAFGDSDEFIASFFNTGFAPQRSRCVFVQGLPVAMLYWFDCSCRGERLAYLYAVATDKAFQGKGLCHQLMADTHAHLERLGYAGTVLVPGNEGLFRLYADMGYEAFGGLNEFSCEAPARASVLRRLTPEEYARLRREHLPAGGVEQEGPLLDLLGMHAEFYAGEDFLLAAYQEADALTVPELLGNAAAAPNILGALGAKRGSFRTPGTGRKFAMYRALTQIKAPAYFGLALD